MQSKVRAAVLTNVWAINAPGYHAEQEEQVANEVTVVSCTCRQRQRSHIIIIMLLSEQWFAQHMQKIIK